MAHESLSLTKLSNKSKILGFTIDNNRTIVPSNDFAQQWLKMSAYDELKKANTLTYQRWMSKITNLSIFFKKRYSILLFGGWKDENNEIEVYSRGIKIQSSKDCVVCYKQECYLIDNCMKAITTKEVIEAIEQYL